MKKIRVLLVDHMGVLKSDRKKFEELADFEDIELLVLTAEKWVFNFQAYPFEACTNGKYKIHNARVAFPGYHHRSFYLRSLKKTLQEFKPDVIHLFQEPYSLFAGQTVLFRNLFSPKSEIVFITWENLNHKKYPFLFASLYKLVENYTYKNAICATPITHTAKEVLQQRGFKGACHVMSWGLDLDLFKKKDVSQLREELGFQHSFIVGFIGRFVEEKGILDLLKAASELQGDFKVLLIGTGPLKSSLPKTLTELNLEHRVKIIDTISSSEIGSYINSMDLLVLPSRASSYWQEQLGRVLIEAMACEVPVIGSDSGEIPHVIGDAGLIFQAGDYRDLRNKIEMIRSGQVDVGGLIRKARERVEASYCWKPIARNLHDLYREIVTN